jgi:hypothetical protein
MEKYPIVWGHGTLKNLRCRANREKNCQSPENILTVDQERGTWRKDKSFQCFIFRRYEVLWALDVDQNKSSKPDEKISGPSIWWSLRAIDLIRGQNCLFKDPRNL